MNWIIKNSRLSLCDKWGNTGRVIADKVSYASFDEKSQTFAVTFENGDVSMYDTNGNSKRRICEGAISAQWQDGKILVRSKTNTRLLDTIGNVVRVL